MEGRLYYINQINDQLTWLATRIASSSKDNRQDMNIVAETTMCGLLNRLYGWNLVNANSQQQNFAGVDLVDEDACIAVQVTSTNTVAKVRHTMEEFFDHQLEKRFDRVIVLVMTCDEPTPGMKKVEYEPYFAGSRDIWNFQYLMKELKEREIAFQKEIFRYLKEELGIGTEIVTPKHQLPLVPAPSASFIAGSRDTELAELKEMLSPDAPVFLWGVGGIGKTEVAIQLARKFAPPKGAYFLHYYDMPGEGEALRETILRAHFSDDQGGKRDYEYDERMDILRTEYPGALLVIDNFDRTGKTLADLRAEKTFKELTAMGICLVFTTRSRVREGVEIKPLSKEMLLGLMRDNLDGVDVSDDELRQLIDAVEGHTLMTMLMARTLAESWGDVTAAQMLQALRSSELDQENFPEVESDQNRSYEQRRIYAHMRALFDLSRLEEADRAVLRCATLLPEDGMQDQLFKACLPKERHKPLRSLAKRGLLRHEGSRLTIHPVIREVCYGELEPTDESCKDFLEQLWDRYDLSREFHADQFTQIAECFSMASDKLEDKVGDWSGYAGRFWSLLGQAQTALRYELQMVERMETNLPPDHPNLAAAYNNVGLTYDDLGFHVKALEYQLKALVIKEKVLPDNLPSLATAYNNVGSIYGDMGEHTKALEYKLKALKIREKVLPADHLDLAQSYNNAGGTYGVLGNHTKALEYKLKALEICEKMLPADHPDLATFYNNVGYTYGNLGDHNQALEYQLKALEIREKVLPDHHPDLANSYNNIGIAYANMENFPLALEYLERALTILEKVLPAGHLYIVYTKENMEGIRFMAMLQEAGISLDDLLKNGDLGNQQEIAAPQ